MKTPWTMASCLTLLLAFAGVAALAQDRKPIGDAPEALLSQNRPERTKLYARNRQVDRFWYDEHPNRALISLTIRDRLSTDVEPRPEAGSAFDAQLPKDVYPEPLSFWRRWTPAPRNYQFVAIRGHVWAIDDKFQDMDDAFHLEFNF